MFLCFLGVLPGYNYSCGLSICNISLQVRKLYGERQSDTFGYVLPYA